MKIIKNITHIAFLLLLVTSCQKLSTDLEVDSKNDPDIKTLASDPVALEATAGDIFHNWFLTISNYYGPSMAMKTMADEATCSWGNAGMKDLSSEPRVAFNNTTSYSYEYITSSYFNSLYSVLSDANMLVFAIENQTAEFSDPNQILLTGKMGQALSVGYLALVFDRVWVPGEGEESIEVDYKEAMTWALDRMDEAIALADAGTGLPEGSISGADVSAAATSKLLNSLAARMLANNARNSAQKSQTDWAKLEQYATNGITEDFTIFMDDINWYDLTPKTYLVYPGWGRVDLRVINLMDPNYPDYWDDQITSSPYWDSAANTLLPANPIDARLESDYQYLTSNNFRPERGIYHFSSYRYSRYDDYITNWVMDLVEYYKSENDMYLAEAKLEQGDIAGAAAIVNAGTRVTRGQLPPVAETYDDVKNAIFYERMVEFGFSTTGISFWEMRRNDLLQAGTLLHFPIPGKALAAIPEPIYTYGGTEGVPGEDYSTGGWR